MRWFSLALLVLSCGVFAASEVTVEETYAEGPPTEIDKAQQYQKALEALVRAELTLMKLDLGPYDLGLQRHFKDWQVKVTDRLKRADRPPTPLLASQFVPWESLFSRVVQTRFAAKPDQGDVWQLTLQGQGEALLIQQHYQRMIKPGALGRKLFLDVQVTPMNFSWEDLALTRPSDFILPLEKEWLKWFADGHLPEGVDEIAFCRDSCATALKEWRELDDTKVGQFVAPDLLDGLLLTVDIKLERTQRGSLRDDTKIALSGGVVLTDLDTKRRLHWVDLNGEQFTLRPAAPKEFNSALATLCYRAPLGKFLEFKTLVNQLALPRQSFLVRLENPGHLGQALRLLEWLKQKGKSMEVEGKLDSFTRKEARILIYFVGEGNKFKSLVSNVKELESEWGKPISVTDQVEGPVFALPGTVKASP